MIRIYKASKGQLKHREIFDEIRKKLITVNGKKAKLYQQKRELAEHFLSSRTTIRKAIESLKQRGYLHSVHGQGTFTLPARSRGKSFIT
ncbi:GntR family transcriptional regulator [Escherichia coli]